MSFITGNNFKNISHYILDEFGFKQNKPIDNNIPIYFVKTDYIHQFFNSYLLPESKFILITHNSDYGIDINHSSYLEYQYLSKWYAQNVNYKHEKLIPIPIGIANPEWPHGNVYILNEIINANYQKETLMYANFNVYTNRQVRQECLKNIPIQYVENNVSFDRYLINTSKAYFSICPMGNGIDSHRIWESLYLKTIPIVENTYNIRALKNKYKLPIYTIEQWNEISDMALTSELYYSIWNNFNIDQLNTNKFLDSIL